MLRTAPCAWQVYLAMVIVVISTTLVASQQEQQQQPFLRRLASASVGSEPFRGQVLGFRRIQFTHRPNQGSSMPSSTLPSSGHEALSSDMILTQAGVASMVEGLGFGDNNNNNNDDADDDDDDHESESEQLGNPHTTTREELENRHWQYRRMMLERERERVLNHVPAVDDDLLTTETTNNNNNDNSNDDDKNKNNKTKTDIIDDDNSPKKQNCTEYSVTEGTGDTVRLCDEVHLMNSTEHVEGTVTNPIVTSDEGNMQTPDAVERPPTHDGGGQMNARDWVWRERSKQARLFMIQSIILQKLGIRQQPHVSDMHLSDNDRTRIMTAFHAYESEIGTDEVPESAGYIKTLGLLTPSCELPRNTYDAWWDATRFRLYFQTQSPQWKQRKIFSATLRVYKKAIESCDTCYLQATDSVDNHMGRSGRRRHSKRNQEQGNQQNRNPSEETESSTTSAMNEEDEEQMTEDTIKITVYSYIKSVKVRRKEKVQELDSIVVQRSEEGWIKLDIKHAISSWYDGTQRNFGLLIRITDNRDRQLDPFAIITPTNCSLNTNFSLPYPLTQGGEGYNGTDPNTNQTTPYLDLVMVGIPRTHHIQIQRTNPIIRHRRHTTMGMEKDSPQNLFVPEAEGKHLRQRVLSSILHRLSEDVTKSKVQESVVSSKKTKHL